MPHRGDMRLLGDILSASPDDILCIARPHDGADYPLRLNGVIRGIAMAELGAQAAAAHASLFGIRAAHMGLVLSLSDIEIHRDIVDCSDPAEVSATRQAVMDRASSYHFQVSAGGSAIVSGDVLLSIEERPG